MNNFWVWFDFNPASFKKVLSNFNWLMFDQLLKVIVGFFLSVFFIRHYSVSDYGAYSYSLSFVYFFTAIAALGLDQIIVRELVKYPGKQDKIVSTSIIIRLVSSLLSLILSLIVISLIRPNDLLIFRLVLAFSFSNIFQSFYVFDFWFQSEIKSKYSVIAKDIAFVLITLLKILLLMRNVSIIYFAWLFSVEFFLSVIGLWFFYIKLNKKLDFYLDTHFAIAMVKDSWPLVLSTLATFLYAKFNQILIGNFLNNERVGIYALSVSLCEFFYLVPMSVCNTIFPFLVKYERETSSRNEKKIKNFFRILFFVSLSFALITTFFGHVFINMFFGDRYLESVRILRIIIWSIIPVTLGMATGNMLVVDNQTKLSLKRTVVGAITNIALAMYLIPRYGIEGAAFSSLIGYIVATYSLVIFSGTQKYRKLLNPLNSLCG